MNEKSIDSLPAERVKFRLAIEAVTVLTNAVESGKNAFVVESLAVDIEEGTFGQRMVVAGQSRHGCRWITGQHCQ